SSSGSGSLSGAGASATNSIAVDVKATIDGDGFPVGDAGIVADSIHLAAADTSIVTADVGSASIAAAVGSTAVSFSISVALANNTIDNVVLASIADANNGIHTRLGDITLAASESST